MNKKIDYMHESYMLTRILSFVGWNIDIVILLILWCSNNTDAFWVFLIFSIVMWIPAIITTSFIGYRYGQELEKVGGSE